jgi:tetratricopeptide (TPR) repeat protein
MKGLLVATYLLLGVSSWAQDNSNSTAIDSISISGKDTVTFETYYYEALNQKLKGNYGKAVELLRKSLRFQPNNADVQFELSINYKSLKDYRQAILFGENAVRFNSEQKWYWLNIADLYSLIRDDKNAARCYSKLSKLDSEFIPEYVRSIARTGNTKLALEKVNYFIETKETEELLVIKRDLLVSNNYTDEAIVLTNKLINLNPNNSDYYFEISDLLLSVNKIDEAEVYVQKGLSNSPDSTVLLRQDFKILMEKEDFDSAFVILNRVFANPRFDFNEKLSFVIEFVSTDDEHKETLRLIESLKSWVEESHEVKIYPIIGNLYKNEGEKEKALSTFRKGFNLGYTDFYGLIDMLILEQELSKFDLLLEDSDKMLELYPSQPTLFLFKGLAQNQLGDYNSSISILEEGVGYVRNNDKLKSNFHSLIADGYYSLKELDKCFAEFDKAVSYDAENILVLNNYSYYLSVNNMHLDKALEMIKQVVEAEPNNATYLDTMAWVYYKQGNYERAKSVLKHAIKNGGDKSADIIEHYGDVLYKLNKENQAVKQWKKAYKLNNSSSILKEKIDKRAIQE